MKIYINSAQSNRHRNFTSPSSLSSGMEVRDSDEDITRIVKHVIKRGNAYEVTFEDGTSFMYDPTDKFEVIQ